MPGSSRLGNPVKQKVMRKEKSALKTLHFQNIENMKVKVWKGNRKSLHLLDFFLAEEHCGELLCMDWMNLDEGARFHSRTVPCASW